VKDEPVRITETRECPMTGDVTIYLSNGRAQTFDRRLAQTNMLEAWLQSAEAVPSTDRVDVVRNGYKIGELPAFWSPMLAKSTSPFYDYRRGDLTLIDGKWHAHRSLGAGDLDCLVGFVRKNSENPHD
jgi:hypothetical protein